MTLPARWLAIGLLTAAVAAQNAPAPDTAIWEEYVRWVEVLRPLPPGQRAVQAELFVKRLSEQGVPAEEARRRWSRVETLRRGSPDREKWYWNGVFKLGGGPSDPLRLLQEAIQKVKPGKALDPGMGRGRNSIWLASVGWEVTGYDISGDALKAAQAYAGQAGVKIKTVEASHDTFDFGESQWDLILCSYNFMDPWDVKWPATLWRALQPKGIAVWQTSVRRETSQAPLKASALLDNWKQFHLIRFEDLDPGVIDDDWLPSRTNRTIRLVVRKEQ